MRWSVRLFEELYKKLERISFVEQNPRLWYVQWSVDECLVWWLLDLAYAGTSRGRRDWRLTVQAVEVDVPALVDGSVVCE